MRGRARGPLPGLAMAAVLVGLLVTLAALQYRWLGQLSAAERDRMRAGLDHATARFCDDIDRELGRALAVFAPLLHQSSEPLDLRLQERVARWRDEAPYPGLVNRVAAVTGGRGGPFAVRCAEVATGEVGGCPWPAAFAAVEQALAAGKPVPPFPDDVMGLVLGGARFAGRHGRLREPVEEPAGEGALLVLVGLDQDYVIGDVLPRLASIYFGGAPGQEYAVDVVEQAPPRRLLFHFGPHVATGRAAGGDVTRAFFELRPGPGMGLGGRGWRERREGGPFAPGSPTDEPRGPDGPPSVDSEPRAGGGRWLLLISHPAGSLEVAVGQARRRSLAIGLSVIALLGLSSFLVVVASQRAQRLARQQLDFVAAVSHELRTPLTAIHSAGQNLADGVVREPEQVRRYGSLIASEGRRLGELVARVLAFAGIRSGQPAYHLEPVDLGALIDDVMHNSEWLLGERGFAVETAVATGLPPVLADPSALRQVLVNLVDNAVKFSAKERWLKVGAALAPSGEVALTVSDHGRGVRKADLERIFEPFFRAEDAAGVPGSGLGLAVVKHVVEAHGGSVTVTSEPGVGTTFEVRLPAAPAGGATA